MTDTVSLAELLANALRAGETALLDAARPGSWPNPRRPAVSGTAGAILALHFADPADSAELIGKGASWLLGAQNVDGGWGTLRGLPSDFVATATAVTALRLTAPDDSAEHVRLGLSWLDESGGVDGQADPMMAQLTGLVLSVAGLHDANRLRRVPVELVLLPLALRRRLLSYLTPPFLALAFFQSRQRRTTPLTRFIDRLTRPRAIRLLGDFNQQEGGVGSYGGDPWLTGLLCTALSRARVAPALVAASVAYLRMTAQPDGSWHLIHGVERERVEVTGMAFSVYGLLRAGHAADHRVSQARDWLANCQQAQPSQVYDCPAGGWTWTGPVGWPNGLETVLVLRVLSLGEAGRDIERIRRRGIDWLSAQQDRRGSWSTFVRNTLVPLDGPCPFITALAVDVLTDASVPATDARIRRALRWLADHQAADGSFEARWHRGGVPATAAVARTLHRLGLGDEPTARRARQWLRGAQLPDGSWSTGRGDPAGTVDETGHAVSALTACGERDAAGRGVRWLVAAQGTDGRWIPGQTCIYIRDAVHYADPLIAQGLAVNALADYRERTW